MGEMMLSVAKGIHCGVSDGRTWETEWPTMRDFYLSVARLAILAMREPTEAMLKAGRDAPVPLRWEAMIDEALR